MFDSFRDEILKAAAGSGLEHRSVPNAGKFTDYFYSSGKKSKCLVHLSGVHGVEGYLGSLIQRQILKESFKDLPFQIVIVHAVNPGGMAAFLRTNLANVDLNRNALEKYEIPNPHLKDFLAYLKTGKMTGFLKTLPAILKLGIHQTVQTVSCGQTEFPDAPFFAGHELQPELVSLRENLKGLIDPLAHLYVLDIHTGLGRFGKETLILDGFGPDEEDFFFRRAFSAETQFSGKTPGSHRAEGTLSLLLKKNWKSFHVFQEFGTDSPLKVLNALIQHAPEQMLEVFFPENESWRKDCVQLGLLRFRQLVENLSAE